MPRCAWLLLATLTALLHHTAGIPTTIEFAANVALWAASTPAVLVIVAALAAWHLLYQHTPTPART